MFPERDRRGRWLLPLAIILSLLVHAAGGEAWNLFAHRLVPRLAKLMPKPMPTPDDIAATSDAITIEKRTVPREVHRAMPRPVTRRNPQQIARVPVQHSPPVPTLPPVPTVPPTIEPREKSVATVPPHGTIYHPRAEPTLEPTSEPTRAPAARPNAAPRNAFSPEQLAALDAQFSKTIAQAERSLTDVPPQNRKPATTMKHYQLVMAGSREQVHGAQGQCRPTQTWYQGPLVWHYQDCDFLYSDGFTEHVTIPWPQHYPRNDDPADHPYKLYAVQDPPDGWVLPRPFPFSRLVCTFYKSECAALIQRERANGDPGYAAP